MEIKDKDIKENFCAPCLLAIPALIGSAGAASSSDTNKKKKMKKIIFWSSIGLIILSIILFIYFKTHCKTCSMKSK